MLTFIHKINYYRCHEEAVPDYVSDELFSVLCAQEVVCLAKTAIFAIIFHITPNDYLIIQPSHIPHYQKFM
jgi:hypothetical protein